LNGIKTRPIKSDLTLVGLTAAKKANEILTCEACAGRPEEYEVLANSGSTQNTAILRVLTQNFAVLSRHNW
jgi:hypothetical protein